MYVWADEGSHRRGGKVPGTMTMCVCKQGAACIDRWHVSELDNIAFLTKLLVPKPVRMSVDLK